MGATGVVPPVHLTPCPWGFVLALNHRLLHLGRAVGIGQVQQREVPRRPLDQRADGGLRSPGGVSGQSEPVEPGVADEAPGDREQAQPKAYGFPPPGWVIGEGQHLQPGGELDGERNDGQPEPVLGVAVQRQVGQPGVLQMRMRSSQLAVHRQRPPERHPGLLQLAHPRENATATPAAPKSPV